MSFIFLIPIVNSAVFTVFFLGAIIGFQNDLANILGVTPVPQYGVSVLKDMVLPIFASFGGAISGAYIAFKLQSDKERKKEVERNIAKINRTIFTLHMQLTDLLNNKDQAISNQQENPFRFLMIQPMGKGEPLSEKLSMEFAQILIDNNKPQLVQDILLAEKRYFNLVYTFQMRNEVKDEIDKISAAPGLSPKLV